MSIRKVFLFAFCLMSATASHALEYPIKAGMQVIYEATTTVPGQFPTIWRYELWVFDERESGRFDAVWANYTNIGTPQEMISGAIPFGLTKSGAKQFVGEREATYQIHDQVNTYLPDISPITSFEGNWKTPPAVTRWYNSYQVTGQTDQHVQCRFAQYGVNNLDQLVGTQTSGDVFFDKATNWPSEIRVQTTQNTQQGQIQINQQVRLTKVINRDEAWISSRKEEAKDFFNVLAQHDQELSKANDNLASATLELAPVFSLWNNWLANNQTSRFYRLGQTQAQVLANTVPILQQFWSKRKSVVGKPAPDWTLPDFTGKQYTLSAIPAQPVLLVFWTKTKWWSLVAMQELVDYQKEFGDKGLVILPIDVDPSPDEAANALKTMGVNLTSLYNTNPAVLEMYGIPLGMFPSTVIIDKNKTIYDVRYGWGNQVSKQIKNRIREAL
ncbi:MAG: TlpA family protein disulfide reductase [Candidatus Omnitrophica bacterium]|nr:TlpA family protein disulfide reductase [Candidatus Omnitrophota bacterium]MCB9770098.1 TlpA family protein disulfide reductase [Candidatus Omnitrophota bacterium]MCB9783674.1 TlpA family protein disulfide reductase [Candidatus Omnitrophota bacterium]